MGEQEVVEIGRGGRGWVWVVWKRVRSRKRVNIGRVGMEKGIGNDGKVIYRVGRRRTSGREEEESGWGGLGVCRA